MVWSRLLSHLPSLHLVSLKLLIANLHSCCCCIYSASWVHHSIKPLPNLPSAKASRTSIQARALLSTSHQAPAENGFFLHNSTVAILGQWYLNLNTLIVPWLLLSLIHFYTKDLLSHLWSVVLPESSFLGIRPRRPNEGQPSAVCFTI